MNKSIRLNRQQSLIDIARYIQEHAAENLQLNTLATKAKLSPAYFQRVFKREFGISPKVMQDAARLALYKNNLQQGHSVTTAIANSGFGSSSRVYGENHRSLGMAAKTYRAGAANESIAYAFSATNLGLVLMAATDRGVCFAQFGDNPGDLLQQLQDEFPKADINQSSAVTSPLLQQWVDAINHCLCQHLPAPDLPLDLRGSAFQIQVWNFLKATSAGDTLSYRELAKGIGKPKAIRAAASACAANSIALLIPCHRVLRSDGSLGGYRWGLERKKQLLTMEQQ